MHLEGGTALLVSDIASFLAPRNIVTERRSVALYLETGRADTEADRGRPRTEVVISVHGPFNALSSVAVHL